MFCNLLKMISFSSQLWASVQLKNILFLFFFHRVRLNIYSQSNSIVLSSFCHQLKRSASGLFSNKYMGDFSGLFKYFSIFLTSQWHISIAKEKKERFTLNLLVPCSCLKFTILVRGMILVTLSLNPRNLFFIFFQKELYQSHILHPYILIWYFFYL